MSRTTRQVLARLERLEVLYKISNIINTTLEPREILRLLLDEVVRITNATSGSVAMVDHKRGILNIETAINIHPRLWKHCKLELGVGVTGYCAWAGKPLRVDDVTRDPRYIRLKTDIRSEMALPMVLEGKVIGVINVDSSRVGAFSEDDEDLCMAVANQSAKVIETARLHDAARRHAAEMESLFTVGNTLIAAGPLEETLCRIVEEGLQLLRGRVCTLHEIGERGELKLSAIAGAGDDWRTPEYAAIQSSLLAPVQKRATPLRVPDIRSNARFSSTNLVREEGLTSLLAVPVVYKNSVFAVLALYSEEPRRFREPEVRLLQLLANQGALAIENARRTEHLGQLEESLRGAERFSLLGTLAAEIAHEIRNPITIINLMMHSIRENASHTSQTLEDLNIVTDKLGRIDAIVEQTLNLARNTESHFKMANPNRLVEELLLFLGRKIEKRKIEVEKNLDPKIEEMMLDPGQIQQVLLNLIVNALQSMPDRGTLRVKTRCASDRTVGRCIKFTIADTGLGIDAEAQKRIFEPFYTTREDGTGLGLFISNKLIRRHNGYIKVKSAAGEGSLFTVVIPLAQEAGNS